MNRRITLHVQMRLLSDTILGAGYSIPGGEDIAVCKDQNGYPYLKGSTLKGLLRESIENWLVWTGGCEADIDALMGASGWVGLTDSQRVQFSEFQMQNPPATPEECYETRTFTSLTDAGTVESGTLRMAACIRRNAVFAGEIDCAGEDEALMKNALASIKWVGTMRSRGFGRVQFAVERSTERNNAVWETGTGTCIRYLLHTDSPVMMTDLNRSKDNSYETREYIPGSAIRGLVVGNLAKEKPDWFAEHRTELLSDAIRFLDAIPAAEKKAALPAIKGFYENKDESVFETVMKDGSFSPGLKRAKLGGFCAIEGDTLEFWRTATDGVTRILRGKGEAEKIMFQTRYISKGQTFEGYIELDDPGMSEVIGAALPKTLWIGADRYDGFGKCTMVSCEAVNQPAWRETYGYQKQEDLTRELYLLAISPFTMMNAAGDPCGLSTEGLAEMLGVGSVEVSVCSTSTSEYGAYNRAWRSREATVRMYDRGSIFKLCCDTVPNLEKLQKLENKGIGVRRAEGFGQILFLKKELFEGIRHKAAAEEKCEKERTNKAAAVRRARYCWVMEQADEVRRSKLSLSQLGTIQALCERAIACGGELSELMLFFNRNLNERGARHASKFGKINELVNRVTSSPVENLIGVPCDDSVTERLRLLCLLFDFSRKEYEKE